VPKQPNGSASNKWRAEGVVVPTHVTVPTGVDDDNKSVREIVPVGCAPTSNVLVMTRPFCARQHCDNDNSQCRPDDFGRKLRGARRISRE
jgi:hypothetical protein